MSELLHSNYWVELAEAWTHYIKHGVVHTVKILEQLDKQVRCSKQFLVEVKIFK